MTNCDSYTEVLDSVRRSKFEIQRLTRRIEEDTLTIKYYHKAIAYMLLPWYRAAHKRVDLCNRDGLPRFSTVRNLVNHAIKNMEVDGIGAYCTFYKPATMSTKKLEATVRVAHHHVQTLASIMLEKHGNNPAKFSAELNDELHLYAMTCYMGDVAVATQTEKTEDQIAATDWLKGRAETAKKLLELLNMFDVVIASDTRERISDIANGPAQHVKKSQSVWIAPDLADRLVRRVSQDPLNVLLARAPDDSVDELDLRAQEIEAVRG